MWLIHIYLHFPEFGYRCPSLGSVYILINQSTRKSKPSWVKKQHSLANTGHHGECTYIVSLNLVTDWELVYVSASQDLLRSFEFEASQGYISTKLSWATFDSQKIERRRRNKTYPAFWACGCRRGEFKWSRTHEASSKAPKLAHPVSFGFYSCLHRLPIWVSREIGEECS